MKAIVFDKIGPPLEVLELREVPKPTIRADEVLLRMVSGGIGYLTKDFIGSDETTRRTRGSRTDG
jgi:D-arabinose 1-dehydrogenase-like Zn-dependent alcohol dehydrogenase